MLAGGLVLSAQAQRTSGALGIGAQAGAPTGVTLKLYNPTTPSYDFLAAWDARDSFFLFNAHAQFNQDLNAQNLEEGELEWYIGPGGFIGVFGDTPGGDIGGNEAVIGASGRLGLDYTISQSFEIYAQVTPRLALLPATDLEVGGGIGFRFYP